VGPARPRSTLRISLSPETTVQDLKNLTKVLKSHLVKMNTLTKM
jgi:cysteine sulfinate desulfinase/cysteine desulfurase-like protein